MSLRAREAIDHMKHALGGLPERLSPLRILNQAGDTLCALHRWKFLERPFQRLETRARRTGTNFTFTAATRTISGGTFTAGTDWDVAFLEGDQVEITDGTAVTKGDYFVESINRTANTIVLESDITTNASNPTDVDLDTDDGFAAVALPSDFSELIAQEADESLVDNLRLTTFKDLLALRTDALTSSSHHFWGAINHGISVNPSGGEPVPRLEIWPTPTSDELNKLRIFYRAKWTRAVDEESLLVLPVYIEPLYLAMVRCFALGYEEEDDATVNDRLQRLMDGPLWRAAEDRDMYIQDRFGPVQGGAVWIGHSVWDWGQHTTVNGPS